MHVHTQFVIPHNILTVTYLLYSCCCIEWVNLWWAPQLSLSLSLFLQSVSHVYS